MDATTQQRKAAQEHATKPPPPRARPDADFWRAVDAHRHAENKTALLLTLLNDGEAVRGLRTA